MSNYKKIIMTLFVLLLGIPLALFGYTWMKLNSIHVDSKYDFSFNAGCASITALFIGCVYS